MKRLQPIPFEAQAAQSEWLLERFDKGLNSYNDDVEVTQSTLGEWTEANFRTDELLTQMRNTWDRVPIARNYGPLPIEPWYFTISQPMHIHAFLQETHTPESYTVNYTKAYPYYDRLRDTYKFTCSWKGVTYNFFMAAVEVLGYYDHGSLQRHVSEELREQILLTVRPAR